MVENEMLMVEPQDETDLDSLDEEEKLLIASENFREELLDEFKENTIQSKEELEKRMKQARVRFQREAASGEKIHNAAFYAILDDLYARALNELIYINFPEPLNDWWYFLYEITETGLAVRLNHIAWHEFTCSRGESFVLLNVPARLLTVSEFAERYGVNPTTVRSWIRRAKIRNAVKCGSEWRIPELVKVRKNLWYVPCQYVWRATLTDVPEKYAFLKEFVGIDLWDDCETTGRYLAGPRLREDGERGGLEFSDYGKKRRKIMSKYKDVSVTKDGFLILNAKERTELELYLISSPLVQLRQDGVFKVNYQIIEEGGEFCEGITSYEVNVEEWLDLV